MLFIKRKEKKASDSDRWVFQLEDKETVASALLPTFYLSLDSFGYLFSFYLEGSGDLRQVESLGKLLALMD